MFGSFEQPNEPLDRMLWVMLSYFNARYKILDYEDKMAHAPPPTPGFPAQRQRVEPGSTPSDYVVRPTDFYEPSGRDTKPGPTRPSDGTYELAGFLNNHHAVLELFRATQSRVWPEDEVVEDGLSFPVLLRDAEAVRRARRARALPSYGKASDLLDRNLIVRARGAMPQRQILG